MMPRVEPTNKSVCTAAKLANSQTLRLRTLVVTVAHNHKLCSQFAKTRENSYAVELFQCVNPNRNVHA